MNRVSATAPGTGDEYGPTGHLLPVRISSLILLFGGTLIAVFTGAMFYVGWLSTREADQQAYDSEVRLFRHVLNSRFTLLARDQSQEAVWDETVKHISLEFSRDYVENELVASLWYNYGLDRTLLVAPGGKILAYAREDEIDYSPDAIAIDGDLKTLIDRAVAQYLGNRITINDGYGARAATSGDRAVMLSRLGNIFQGAFQDFDGRPAWVSAMAIVPDRNSVALPDGPPVILVSAKFIDADEVAYLRHQLGFQSLEFIPSPPGSAPAHHPGTHKNIVTLSGAVVGTFVWSNPPPGARIWSAILPIVVALGALVGIAALLVARRLGAMSNLLESSERRTRHMSHHDSLTGLANRLRFGEALAEAIAGLPAEPFAVIACDLDRFKAVNDGHGHAAGDSVIRAVAKRLKLEVGGSGMVSRSGGDEFILLIHAFADQRRLDLLCAGIIDSVIAPIALDGGQETDVGVSLGVAQAPGCGATAAEILRAADEALYAAKELGRGRAVFAEQRVGQSTDESRPAGAPVALETERAARAIKAATA